MEIFSNNEKEFVLKSLQMEQRLDGRNLIDHRKISLSFGLELGELELTYGGTRVFSKVIAEIVEPNKERLSEGFLKFKIDLSTFQNETNIDNNKKYSNEISKLIERVIKDSK